MDLQHPYPRHSNLFAGIHALPVTRLALLVLHGKTDAQDETVLCLQYCADCEGGVVVGWRTFHPTASFFSGAGDCGC